MLKLDTSHPNKAWATRLIVFDRLFWSKRYIGSSPLFFRLTVNCCNGLCLALNSTNVAFLRFCGVEYTAAQAEEVAKDEAEDGDNLGGD